MFLPTLFSRTKGSRIVALVLGLALIALAGCSSKPAPAPTPAPAPSSQPPAASQPGFTEWGWPQPYEKVSDKSIQWLKDKGWWPLTVAWQTPWSGENTVAVVMRELDLFGKRGIQAKFQPFDAGPPVNEALIAGRVQVGPGGNFPFTSLLDKKVPVKSLVEVTPNIGHATIVPPDSPAKTLKDLKNLGHQAVIGVPTGTSGEFYLQEALKANGLTAGKDVILKNMTPADIALLPKGIDAVVIWEPTVSLIVNERKTGRVIDWIFPYNFYEGNWSVRQEIIDNAPDVAQAVTDTFAEATLWIRLHVDEAVDMMSKDPSLKAFSKELLKQQTEIYNVYLKPTTLYINAKFWADENARIAEWLYQGKRTTNHLTAQDYLNAFEPKFMANTFAKLGWKVPDQPPFLPAGWSGQIGKIPYPDYANAATLKAPQPFPEKGDLTKPWQFGGKTYNP